MVNKLSHERLSKFKIHLHQELIKNVYEATMYREDNGKILKDHHRIIYINPSNLVFDYLLDERLLCEGPHLSYTSDIEQLRNIGIKKNKKIVQSWPKELRNAINDKNTLVYLDHSIEGWSFIRFEDVCEILGIPKERLVWVTSKYAKHGHPIFNDVKSVYRNWWEIFLQNSVTTKSDNPEYERQNFEKQLDLCKNRHQRNKLCTSYMRRLRLPRLAMCLFLNEYNLLEDMYWSLGVKVDGETSIEPAKFNFEHVKGIITSDPSVFISDRTYEWFSSIEENVTCDDNTLVDNLAAGYITWEHVFNTKFMLVNETIPKHLHGCEHPYMPFLSEKAYKPFVAGQPFVIHGCAGSVSALREQNYYTFDEFIDHGSYDNESCPIRRANAVAKEIKRLNEIPDETWKDYLRDISSRIEHNYNVVMNAKDNVQQIYDYDGNFFKF